MIKYFSRKSYLFIFIVIVVIFSGCGLFYCLDSISSPPKDLFESNEYIFTAYLDYADTLVNLGSIDHMDYFLMKYVLSPHEIIKGEMNFEKCSIWYIIYHNNLDDYWHTLEFSGTSYELIYGNKLTDQDDILNVMDPLVYASISDLNNLLYGTQPDNRWNAIVEDSIIATRLLEDDMLKYTLGNDLHEGHLVISGTENSMSTQLEFYIGSICYCEIERENGDIKWGWGYNDTREEYLKKLRKLAMKSGGP